MPEVLSGKSVDKFELPMAVIPKTLFSPKNMLFYGPPKVGKTKILTELFPDRHLILEGDPEGASMYDCMWLPLDKMNYEDFYKVINNIIAQGEGRIATGLKGKDSFPYVFISVDNATEIQEIARMSLTKEYLHEARKAPKQTDTQKEALADPEFRITDLPHGAGHLRLRERVKAMFNDLSRVCHKLIVIAHVKDKEIPSAANTLVKVNDIFLDGKLSSIVAARMDVIGYLSRSKDGTLMVNFSSNDVAARGARFKYLAGKSIPFDWKTIIPDEFGLSVPEE